MDPLAFEIGLPTSECDECEQRAHWSFPEGQQLCDDCYNELLEVDSVVPTSDEELHDELVKAMRETEGV